VPGGARRRGGTELGDGGGAGLSGAELGGGGVGLDGQSSATAAAHGALELDWPSSHHLHRFGVPAMEVARFSSHNGARIARAPTNWGWGSGCH
jgi:hypothetical protein